MYESSTKETSGCASNLLAYEDLGQFEEAHHWNIQAKFYNEKFPLVYESDKTRDSLSWRSWCYFEAQVWKRIVTLPPFFWVLLFLFGLSLFLAFLFKGQCSNNDDHHTSIYLQLMDYNSILNKIWLYMNASGGVPGCAMTQEWHVWKNYEWWLCHKYDVNYMIMQSNMIMMKRVIITERWKVAWQYILEWLWKCHNR